MEKIPKLKRQAEPNSDKLSIDTPKENKPKITRKKKAELKVSDIQTLFSDTQKQTENIKPLFTKVNNNHDSDSDNEQVHQTPVKQPVPQAPKLTYQPQEPVKHFFQSNPIQQEQPFNIYQGLPIFFRR